MKQHCIRQLVVGNFRAVSVWLPVETRQDGWVPCLDLLLACCSTQGTSSASMSCYRMSIIILTYLVLLYVERNRFMHMGWYFVAANCGLQEPVRRFFCI